MLELKTRQDLKHHKLEVHHVSMQSSNLSRSITPTSKLPKSNSAGFSGLMPNHKTSSVSLDSPLIKQQSFSANTTNNNIVDNYEDGNSENGEKSTIHSTKAEFFDEEDKTNNNNNITTAISSALFTDVAHLLNSMAASSGQSNEILKKKNNDEFGNLASNDNIPLSSASSTTTVETNLSSVVSGTNGSTQKKEKAERCRFCGDYLSTVTNLQQHMLEEHSDELLKQFATAAALDNASNENEQLTALENEDIITQVAMQMQQANQQQQQVSNNCWPASVANAAKLALAKYF